VAPSSPAIALFKDGKPVYILERRLIEQMDDQMVAECLTEAFDRYCSSKKSWRPLGFPLEIRAIGQLCHPQTSEGDRSGQASGQSFRSHIDFPRIPELSISPQFFE